LLCLKDRIEKLERGVGDRQSQSQSPQSSLHLHHRHRHDSAVLAMDGWLAGMKRMMKMGELRERESLIESFHSSLQFGINLDVSPASPEPFQENFPMTK
jgi:hypothetical protein